MHMLKQLLKRPEVAKKRQTVLIHAHMFKNAGTSFDSSLTASFGNRFVDHRNDTAMRQGASYLEAYLLDNPDLLAISSHWITFPLPAVSETKLDLVLLFRDPIERTRSVYEFERRQQGEDHPGTRNARNMSFRDYVSWRLEANTGPVIKNFHTRFCSGDYFGADLDTMYSRAQELVRSTPLLGLVHRYHESMVLFEFLLKDRYPTLDLAYTVLNTSRPDEELAPDQRRRDIENELADLLPDLLAANKFDLQLYDLTQSLFQSHLNLVPDLPERIQSLQERCKALQ